MQAIVLSKGKVGKLGVCVLLVEAVGTRLFFTTNPGLEGVVEAEWRARLQAVGIK